MVADGGLGTATAVGSAANISLRLFQIIYEFKAVGQQTQDLLDSTTHVSSTLESAETMRRQKSAFLTADERIWIDNIIVDTKRCLKSVAALVEPARVDIQTNSGRVGFLNRSRFVFRDSPKVANNLARLGLAHQSLNAAMGVLCSKGTYTQPVSDITTTRSHRQQPLLLSDDGEMDSSAYSHYQHPFFIAEIQSPDRRLATINFPLESPAETNSETTHVSPSIMSKHEGLEVVDHDDPKLLADSQGLEVQTKDTKFNQPMEKRSIYRSKGRAWLESRSMQRR
jgi:hypothetical protein